MGERHWRDVRSSDGVRAGDGVVALIHPADSSSRASSSLNESRKVAWRIVRNGDSE